MKTKLLKGQNHEIFKASPTVYFIEKYFPKSLKFFVWKYLLTKKGERYELKNLL